MNIPADLRPLPRVPHYACLAIEDKTSLSTLLHALEAQVQSVMDMVDADREPIELLPDVTEIIATTRLIALSLLKLHIGEWLRLSPGRTPELVADDLIHAIARFSKSVM